MSVIVVAERIAPAGLALLSAEHEVRDLSAGGQPLDTALADADALVVRSATQVDAALLDAAPKLRVVGRAGVGVDNIDLAAATQRGCLVVNAPLSNVVSAAEHTVALLLAQARAIPWADAGVRAGRWDRTARGVELYAKTLGIIGLGRVGGLVAQRMRAFGMRLVAFDPYAAPDRAAALGVELMDLDDVLRAADFVTVHVPRTAETVGLVGAREIALMRPGARLVNAARGGTVDETALATAIADGRLGGAALDVFDTEPPESSPLLPLDDVVVTPHLGAATREAQDRAGRDIAGQVLAALADEPVAHALNTDAAAMPESARPFRALAQRLGHTLARLAGDRQPRQVEVTYHGPIAHHSTGTITTAALVGLLSAQEGDRVTPVNARLVARDRNLRITETHRTGEWESVISLSADDGEPSVSATTGRLLRVCGLPVDIPLASHLLLALCDGSSGVAARALAESAEVASSVQVTRSGDGSRAIIAAVFDAAPAAALPAFRRLVGSDDCLVVDLSPAR